MLILKYCIKKNSSKLHEYTSLLVLEVLDDVSLYINVLYIIITLNLYLFF